MGVIEAGTYSFVGSFRIGRWQGFMLYLHISDFKIPRGGDDTMVWQLNHSGVFDVRSFYNSLLEAPSVFFPWQCIWSVKVPKMVSFFLWTAARDGILSIDNLVKKNFPLVN